MNNATTKRHTYDKQTVLDHAAGRWPSLIAVIGNLSPSILDGHHHPCPKCGGKDRFQALKDFSQRGGLFCRRCHSKQNADGISSVMWLRDCSFGEALQIIGDAIAAPTAQTTRPQGSRKAKGRPSQEGGLAHHRTTTPPPAIRKEVNPGEKFSWVKWNTTAEGEFCRRKPGIAAQSLHAVGCRHGQTKSALRTFLAMAIPFFTSANNPSTHGDKADVVSFSYYHGLGFQIPFNVFDDESKTWKSEPKKILNTVAKEPGLAGDWSRLATATEVWFVEGCSDLLAAYSFADLPSDVIVLTNFAGAPQDPPSWLESIIKGKRVFVLRDTDDVGTESADRWGGICARVSETRAFVIPREEFGSSTHTQNPKDLRDFALGGGTFSRLREIGLSFSQCEAAAVDQAEAAKEEPATIWEGEDSPHRLAKANLEYYRQQYGGRLVFWRDAWWRWKGGKYIQLGHSELRAKLTEFIHREFVSCWQQSNDQEQPVRKVTQSIVTNVLGAMAGLCTVPTSIAMPCWLPDRSSRHYLTLKNGILDLKALFDGGTREECLHPLSSDWFSDIQLPYELDLEAKCPKWEAFVKFAMEEDWQRCFLLQEWAGYLLQKGNPYQRFLVMEGEGGNGKTVFMAGLTAMVGKENVSSVSLDQFSNRFALASTLGKLLNLSPDTEQLESVNEGVLKQFTGGDAMEFDRKNLQPINAIPSAKLVASWNGRPHFRDKSEALWRRMLIVPFNRAPSASQKVFGMDSHEYWLEQGEAPGILRWAIQGLYRLKQQNGFTECDVSRQAIESYRGEVNPAREFLMEYLEECAESVVEGPHLYKLYRLWCEENGHRFPNNLSVFGKEIKRVFKNSERVRLKKLGTRICSFGNLKYTVDEICGEKTDPSF